MTKILLVDNEERLRQNLAKKLESEGYEVITSANGTDGLDKARQIVPDLVVLDIMLPGHSGIDICRILQRTESTSHIPILIITARGMVADKIEGLESGADDYLVKPFSLGEFLSRVRVLLRPRPGKHRNLKLTFGNISVDRLARRFYKDDIEVRLTKMEFNLLVYLMENPGRASSRELILKKVWGDDADTGIQTVSVHIRLLRKKIEVNPSRPLRIVTVHGAGYRFVG